MPAQPTPDEILDDFESCLDRAAKLRDLAQHGTGRHMPDSRALVLATLAIGAQLDAVLRAGAALLRLSEQP